MRSKCFCDPLRKHNKTPLKNKKSCKSYPSAQLLVGKCSTPAFDHRKGDSGSVTDAVPQLAASPSASPAPLLWRAGAGIRSTVRPPPAALVTSLVAA